jgi:hypothetical protein
MNATRFLAIVSSITVACAVLAGLYLSGSPTEQRLLRLDERRVSDLMQLSFAIRSYQEQSAKLPTELAVLVDGQRLRSVPKDPASSVTYTYEIMGANAYRLCAEFARASLQTESEDFWAHPAGAHCFDLMLNGRE